MTQTMTAPQLHELKTLLHARRKDLEAQMEQNRANLELTESTAGSVSQDEKAPLARQTREVDARLTALDAQELVRIDRALEAMEDGSYGLCDECGCAIPFERLKIEPATQHCVKCKSNWERQAARGG
jgi:DnaK suppressor protein